MKDTTYKKEEIFLSEFAFKSKETKGRQREEEDDLMRTPFQRDRDRILYSKAFRRLKNKTQVFYSPEGDHFMTRLTHTLDVSQVSRSIARCLDLNEDLCEAISLGHDLGHTPFGHAGERILNELNPNGFMHNKQSLRVVDVLENDGAGLNLTYEVRDGILEHKKDGHPATLEGKVVSISDRIAYLNHDIDDAIRANIFEEKDLPEEAIEVLGRNSGKRINNMIMSIYRESVGKNHLGMEEPFKRATEILRSFMFDRVYLTKESMENEERAKLMISCLYNYYKKNPDKLPEMYGKMLGDYDIDTIVSDYISSMTDRYAIYKFDSIFVPSNFSFIK